MGFSIRMGGELGICSCNAQGIPFCLVCAFRIAAVIAKKQQKSTAVFLRSRSTLRLKYKKSSLMTAFNLVDMRGVEPRSVKKTTALSTRLAYVCCRPKLPVSGPPSSKPQLSAVGARRRPSAVPYGNDAERGVVSPTASTDGVKPPSIQNC